MERHILVVEDQKDIADLIAMHLRDLGHAVDCVHDGGKGYEAARTGRYDLIVLDVMLPVRDGLDVVRSLRMDRIDIPVLMLTARSGEIDRVLGLELGADDYLTKPFHLVVLVARLRALVRRSAPERDECLRLGDLSLDPASHQVMRGADKISLTAREFALLEYLLRRRGKVVSKQHIADAVWGQDFAGDLNVVEVYVGYLRRKIDAPFGTQSVETLRGVGCLLYTSPSPRDGLLSRMPSSA